MRRAVLASIGLVLAGCTIEVPPSVPGPPERRAVVVPFSDGDEHGFEVTAERCSSLCPAPGRGEVLDQCHGTSLSGAMIRHRRALGETDETWVICYYGGD